MTEAVHVPIKRSETCRILSNNVTWRKHLEQQFFFYLRIILKLSYGNRVWRMYKKIKCEHDYEHFDRVTEGVEKTSLCNNHIITSLGQPLFQKLRQKLGTANFSFLRKCFQVAKENRDYINIMGEATLFSQRWELQKKWQVNWYGHIESISQSINQSISQSIKTKKLAAVITKRTGKDIS